jgi:hypothetical protein
MDQPGHWEATRVVGLLMLMLIVVLGIEHPDTGTTCGGQHRTGEAIGGGRGVNGLLLAASS